MFYKNNKNVALKIVSHITRLYDTFDIYLKQIQATPKQLFKGQEMTLYKNITTI